MTRKSKTPRNFSTEQLAYMSAKALFEVRHAAYRKHDELIDAEAEKLGIPTPFAILPDGHPLMARAQELLDEEEVARKALYQAAYALFDWASETTLAKMGTEEQRAGIRKAIAEVKTMAFVEPFFEELVKISMALDVSLPACQAARAQGGTSMTWSNPYYGVTHLELPNRNFQITAEDHGTFVTCYLLALKSAHPFTPVQERDFTTISEAKLWGEEAARGLYG